MTYPKPRRPVPKRASLPIGPMLMTLGGALILSVVIFAVWRSAAPGKVPVEVTGAPGLRIKQAEFDLGDVKLGQTVEVSFEVSNAGDQPLRFRDTPYVEVVEGC